MKKLTFILFIAALVLSWSQSSFAQLTTSHRKGAMRTAPPAAPAEIALKGKIVSLGSRKGPGRNQGHPDRLPDRQFKPERYYGFKSRR